MQRFPSVYELYDRKNRLYVLCVLFIFYIKNVDVSYL